MSNIGFTPQAFKDYEYWQNVNRKTLSQINKLIKDILRNGKLGMGHPEALKGKLFGYYSRHIDEKNRLVYKIEDEYIEIYSCKGHYDDK